MPFKALKQSKKVDYGISSILFKFFSLGAPEERKWEKSICAHACTNWVFEVFAVFATKEFNYYCFISH